MKRTNRSFFCLAVMFVQILNVMVLSAQKPAAVFKVTSGIVNPKPVSRLIYGNFIELGFGRQIEGMWSEKLFNASFEEITPYKSSMWSYLRRTPEDDLTKKPWWHSGYEEDPWYSVLADGKDVAINYRRYGGFYHGLQAVMLNNSQSKLKAFLAQDGIWINKGINCLFKGYIMNNRTAGDAAIPLKVTIGLYPLKDFGHPIVEKTITVDANFFREYSTDLNAGNYVGSATFAVSVEPGTSASFDGFSLMPADNINGWRKDVIAALKQIYVPIIRFPGGCFASFYNWRSGIGPRADRKPVNSEYWGGLEENNVGTAEFIKMCRVIGAEPFICINMLTGSPMEAAEWISYCNSTSGGRMNILRKEHGYPEPLTVKYWELDNETYRRFGYEEYAKRCVEFSKAMKAADPAIQLVMVGYAGFNANLKEMLDIAGPYIDLVTDRSGIEPAIKKDLDIISEYNRSHTTNIRLCNTEWWAQFPQQVGNKAGKIVNPELDPPRMAGHLTKITWNYAMNVASRLLMFQRLGGDFEFSNFNNLCNTWGQNIINSPKDSVYISAVGRVFELMSRSKASWVLTTDTISAKKGVLVQSTTTVNKDKLIFYLLNYLPDQSQVSLDLSSFKVTSKEAVVKSVYSDDPFSANTPMNRNAILSAAQVIKLDNPKKPVFTIKPWSVTEITINL
jgi:alpha-L-arabinofuranosidase